MVDADTPQHTERKQGGVAAAVGRTGGVASALMAA